MRHARNFRSTGVFFASCFFLFASVGWSQENRPAALGVTLREPAVGAPIEGAVVSSVAPRSPAALAGLRPGDEIRFVDDQRILSSQDLVEEIRAREPGSTVDLVIVRGGARQLVRTTLVPAAAISGAGPAPNRSNSIAAYRSVSGSSLQGEAAANPEVRVLERQILRLQRQMENMRANQNGRLVEQQDMRSIDWGWNGHGVHNDDPALFQ